MGIQKDSEELLVYIYKQKIEGKEIPNGNGLMVVTKWDNDRILFALEYLIDKRLLKGQIIRKLGSTKPQKAIISDITYEGIDIIENPNKFKKHFEHTIDLKIYKYSWGAAEK